MPLEPREFFEQIFMALTIGGGEVAKQLPGISSSPELQGAIAVMAPPLGLALGRGIYGVFESRKPHFFTGYAKAFGNDPDKAKAHAEEQKDNPDFQETMYRTFRLMMDAVDRSVVETLGYLAGQYTYEGKRPDSHFPSLGRLLCELEPGELDDLKKLVVNVLALLAQHNKEWPQPLDSSTGDFIVKWDEKLRGNIVGMDLGGSRCNSLNQSIPAAGRLFWLLKREGFADAVVPSDEEQLAQSMRVSYQIAELIRSTIDPQLAT